jgi:predicted thioredoxin/glutaredoxin
MATYSQEVALKMFYSVKRKNDKGQIEIITGPSVRLAEVIASCWNNLRVSTRITANDGKSVTAQGVCWDLETNIAVSAEVQRSILKTNGYTYSNEMQVLVMMAAQSIAFRNAIFKVIPRSLVETLEKGIKSVAMGEKAGFDKKRDEIIAYFEKQHGVKLVKILHSFEKTSVRELSSENVFELYCLQNAINEKTTTAQEYFGVNGIQEHGRKSKLLGEDQDDSNE